MTTKSSTLLLSILILFFLQTISVSGQCPPGQIEVLQSCVSCADFHNQNQCLFCSLQKCDTSCMPGFVPQSGTCVQCQVATSDNTCSLCEPTSYSTASCTENCDVDQYAFLGVCYDCSVQFGASCAACSKSQCTQQCNNFQVAVNGQCVDKSCQEIYGIRCLFCDTSLNLCTTTCSGGFYVDTASNPDECLDCASIYGTSCAACDDAVSGCINDCSLTPETPNPTGGICCRNDQVGLSGVCVDCSSNFGPGCNTCDNNECLACNDGYQLDNKVCAPCSLYNGLSPLQPEESCALCDVANGCTQICTSSQFASNGICVECTTQYGPFCQQCNSVACTVCEFGFQADGITCVEQCETNQYGTYPDCTDCSTLNANCLTCTDANTCNSCGLDISGNQLFVLGADCVSDCGSGLYPDASNVCQPCLSGCLSCQDGTTCDDCGVGNYFDGTVCTTCPSSLGDTCSACSIDGTQCTNCGSGYFFDGTVCDLCQNIIPECLQCNIDGTVCSDCGTLHQWNGVICEQIPCTVTNCIQCTVDVNVCEACDASHVLYDGNCDNTECPAKNWNDAGVCKQCLSDCASCNSGTTCDVCDSGFYWNGSACVTCSSSIPNCNTCDASGTTCLSCQATHVLFEGKCDNTQCPQKYWNNAGACENCLSNCASCNSGSTCTTCDSGFFWNGAQCASCSSSLPNCATCNAAGTTCSSCDATHVLYNGNCDNTNCPAQFWNNAGVCQNCLANCASCSSGSTCTTCNSGFFWNGQSCATCSSSIANCQSCNAAGTVCLDCGSQYLKNGQCVSNCGNGFRPVNTPTPKTCQACQDTNCLTCPTAANDCDSCASGWVIDATGKLCVVQSLPCNGLCTPWKNQIWTKGQKVCQQNHCFTALFNTRLNNDVPDLYSWSAYWKVDNYDVTCATAAPFDKNKTYNTNQLVTYNGSCWKAKWQLTAQWWDGNIPGGSGNAWTKQ